MGTVELVALLGVVGGHLDGGSGRAGHHHAQPDIGVPLDAANNLSAFGCAASEQGIRSDPHTRQLEAGLRAPGRYLDRPHLQPLGGGRHDEHPNAAVVETGRHQSDVGVETARDQHLGAVEHVSTAVVAQDPATQR